MSKTLTEIAQHLYNTNKKVQLIYAFNGTGKTRLSQALKELVAPQAEDLFYWNNDLENGTSMARLCV